MNTADVLTPEATEFLTLLQREFGGERAELLAARHARAQRLRGGELPDFLEETRSVREGDWHVPPAPADLADRRVEITGPTDRKMVINALNSGAKVFMTDFEDANSPTWENMIEGQRNLSEAIDRTIRLEHLVYPRAVRWFLEDRLVIDKGVVRVKGIDAAKHAEDDAQLVISPD